MLEVDLLIYGHCPALLKECHPCPHGSLDSLGHAFVGGARPTELLWPPRPATSSFHRVRLILVPLPPSPWDALSFRTAQK